MFRPEPSKQQRRCVQRSEQIKLKHGAGHTPGGPILRDKRHWHRSVNRSEAVARFAHWKLDEELTCRASDGAAGETHIELSTVISTASKCLIHMLFCVHDD